MNTYAVAIFQMGHTHIFEKKIHMLIELVRFGVEPDP